MEHTTNFQRNSWLISTLEIEPGGSAILGGNLIAFYGIHYVAISLICISMASCLFVIYRILLDYYKKNESNTRIDFALRFPLYLALADCLWGISHFIDHAYLLSTETFPETSLTTIAISVNIWFFLGYQQLMHASLSTYTYLRVVHRKTLELGTLEWRLHILCFLFLTITALVNYFIDGFGCSGYWLLENRRSKGGLVVGILLAIVCTLNAICTTLGYHLIQNKVQEQIQIRVTTGNGILSNRGYHSTATQCLATFVRNAACLYCPFALLSWALVFQNFFGVIEPLSAFTIVVIANSSGWANAWGYLQNERIKKARLEMIAKGVVSQNISHTETYTQHSHS